MCSVASVVILGCYFLARAYNAPPEQLKVFLIVSVISWAISAAIIADYIFGKDK
jgi:hypothetical protein